MVLNNILKVTQLSSIVFFSLYIVLLQLNENLFWYINPRFEVFTLFFAVLALVISVLSIFIVKNTEEQNVSKLELFGISLFVLIIILGFILKPATLSADILSQRESNLNTLYAGSEERLIDLFQSSENYTLGDWIKVLNTSNASQTYEGAAVKIEGFVANFNNEKDYFRASKFILTCCAVDARPVGMIVNQESWDDSFAENDWISVEGTLQFNESFDQFEIVPENITTIDTPKNPYIY